MTYYELEVDGVRFGVEIKSDSDDENLFSLALDGKSYHASISSMNKNEVSVRLNEKSFNVELLDEGIDFILLRINGEEFKIARKAGREGQRNSLSIEELYSPLPGKVISVLVRPGDAVKLGDEVVIIESMKMETALRADVDGVVAEVLVKKDDVVKRGQKLLSIRV
ncbi:MAG: biotin/lipoyl-containing protein [Conexivisphaerales archaeon]